ncbi:MAG: CDP-archaeol synthase [Desulfocapsaceae bacterium]|nr:CDP-archaeol synthase [Desulfocapsaceae bacterium]
MSDIFKVMFFLLWVNSLPPIVTAAVGDRYGLAIDCGIMWFDGQPLFGGHKTVRGLTVSAAGGLMAFPLLGVTWWQAGTAALLAMTGDLVSSFIKRRFTLQCGRAVAGLDQIFESLLPLLFLNRYLPLNLPQDVLIIVFFTVISSLCSHAWYYITGRPLPKNYPRTVRSRVRFREWRSCHEPLARWQAWFNLTSFLSDQIFLTWFFKATGLYSTGEKNALDLKIEEISFNFEELPNSFDGFRILFLVDLHLDGLDGLDGKIAEMLRKQEVDLCCIGGDVRMKTYGPSAECIRKLKNLMQCVHARHGILGVLGNHDCIEMLPDFEEAGIVMLVNDSWPIEINGDRIWVLGVDDPHYYRLHAAGEAAKGVPEEAFSIFLAHSPEAFEDAARVQASLYLCGHTHGGQICLIEGTPVFTNSRAPRYTAAGSWQFENMQGYTSRGVGPSSIPVRFNCPGEITVITLRKIAGKE